MRQKIFSNLKGREGGNGIKWTCFPAQEKIIYLRFSLHDFALFLQDTRHDLSVVLLNQLVSILETYKSNTTSDWLNRTKSRRKRQGMFLRIVGEYGPGS